MQHHDILRIISKLFIPFILIFALYVQFHGDYGPGGGFQAGVLFAVAFILYALIFGVDKVKSIVPLNLVRTLSVTGVLLYAGVGVCSMLFDGSFLQYGVLSSDPVHGQHIGIMLVELGVGITVASIMLLFFYSFIDV